MKSSDVNASQRARVRNQYQKQRGDWSAHFSPFPRNFFLVRLTFFFFSDLYRYPYYKYTGSTIHAVFRGLENRGTTYMGREIDGESCTHGTNGTTTSYNSNNRQNQQHHQRPLVQQRSTDEQRTPFEKDNPNARKVRLSTRERTVSNSALRKYYHSTLKYSRTDCEVSFNDGPPEGTLAGLERGQPKRH